MGAEIAFFISLFGLAALVAAFIRDARATSKRMSMFVCGDIVRVIRTSSMHYGKTGEVRNCGCDTVSIRCQDGEYLDMRHADLELGLHPNARPSQKVEVIGVN